MAALKDGYKAALGQLCIINGRIERPDWNHSVIALSRANLWRKMRAVSEKTGRYPYRVETDCIWYPIKGDDPIHEAPLWDGPNGKAGIVLGEKLGQFKIKGIREIPKGNK